MSKSRSSNLCFRVQPFKGPWNCSWNGPEQAGACLWFHLSLSPQRVTLKCCAK